MGTLCCVCEKVKSPLLTALHCLGWSLTCVALQEWGRDIDSRTHMYIFYRVRVGASAGVDPITWLQPGFPAVYRKHNCHCSPRLLSSPSMGCSAVPIISCPIYSLFPYTSVVNSYILLLTLSHTSFPSCGAITLTFFLWICISSYHRITYWESFYIQKHLHWSI